MTGLNAALVPGRHWRTIPGLIRISCSLLGDRIPAQANSILGWQGFHVKFPLHRSAALPMADKLTTAKRGPEPFPGGRR